MSVLTLLCSISHGTDPILPFKPPLYFSIANSISNSDIKCQGKYCSTQTQIDTHSHCLSSKLLPSSVPF